MPSITVAELQKLIETASYQHYARTQNSRDVNRASSESLLQKSRSRSSSRTRQHVPRPSSAPRKINSDAKEDVTKKYERKRPQSAKPAVYSYKESDLDYTGVTNMMQGLKLKHYKKWRSKSQSTSDLHSSCEISHMGEKESEKRKFRSLETENFSKNRELDPNLLRKSRSSSYSKFRYPSQLHNRKNTHEKFVLEQNIPPSLRRFPRYINQPVKQNCSYVPAGRSVTSVKLHNIKSSSLPAPAVFTSKPPVPPSKTKPPAMIDSQANNASNNLEDYERERNGTFHYVYEGPPSNFNTIVEVQDDSPRQSSRISQIIPISEAGDVVKKQPTVANDDVEDIDELQDFQSDNKYLDDFEYANEDANSIKSPTQEEKLSYGNMSDLQSIGEIDEETFTETQGVPSETSQTKDKTHWSSEEEIEEDIPDMKPANNISKNSAFKYRH